MRITFTLSTDKQVGVRMLNFKKFDIEDFKTDMYGHVTPTDLIFIDDEGILRLGCLYEDYHGNGCSSYYFRSNGVNYPTYDSLYSIVEV